VTEVADRCMKAPGGGPALLFERPTLTSGVPARYPVAVNPVRLRKRMALALGVECLDRSAERIATLLNMKVRTACSANWRCCRSSPRWQVPPKAIGGKPPCQELVIREQDVDLRSFPVAGVLAGNGGPTSPSRSSRAIRRAASATSDVPHPR